MVGGDTACEPDPNSVPPSGPPPEEYKSGGGGGDKVTLGVPGGGGPFGGGPIMNSFVDGMGVGIMPPGASAFPSPLSVLLFNIA